MQQAPVEVQTADGSFLVSRRNDNTLCCQRKTPLGTEEIAYWNDIPEKSRPDIQRAVDDLTRGPVFNSVANNNFRWD
ncbi:MAG TPA: hypothetical protein VG753_00085 [Candidatus Paceibacterota bacterium]|nr:hypothetical protein [Candidatus Paceibacterota bacterium]